MGTVIVSAILFIIVTLIVKSICRKHIEAKKKRKCLLRMLKMQLRMQ